MAGIRTIAFGGQSSVHAPWISRIVEDTGTVPMLPSPRATSITQWTAAADLTQLAVAFGLAPSPRRRFVLSNARPENLISDTLPRGDQYLW